MTPEDRDDAPEPTTAPEADGLADGGFGSPVADRVYDLLAPVVATTGCELVDVQFAGGILRLAVERVEASDRPTSAAIDEAAESAETGGTAGAATGPERDGITTDVLAEVNRLVSPLLDQHDPVPGRYTLEVSSPGVERPLRRAEHFARAIGETIVVKTVPGHETRRFRGLLRSVDARTLSLDVVEMDGVDLAETLAVDLDMVDVASARTHFEWGPTPKKGGKNTKKNKNRSAAGKNTASKSTASENTAGPAPSETATPATTTEEERGRT